MRKPFLILYDAHGKRRLAADTDLTSSEERALFEKFKKDGLPKGCTRAEWHDSSLGGSFLTLGGVDRQAAHVKKVEKITAAAEKRRKEQEAIAAKALKSAKPVKPAATVPKKPAANVDRQEAHARKVEKLAAAEAAAAEKRRAEQDAAAAAEKRRQEKAEAAAAAKATKPRKPRNK